MIVGIKKVLKSFKTCPVPRKDKPVRVGISGTNPLLYNDEKKQVIYDDKGGLKLTKEGIGLNILIMIKNNVTHNVNMVM